MRALPVFVAKETQPKARGIQAKFEHVFRVIKCQLGYRKTRYASCQKPLADGQPLSCTATFEGRVRLKKERACNMTVQTAMLIQYSKFVGKYTNTRARKIRVTPVRD